MRLGTRRSLDGIRALLLGDAVPSEATAARLELVRLWQQLTGPVMAKGREDTAALPVPVLLAQAEVGNDPSDPTIDAVARFHTNAAPRASQSGRPGLTATTTHDTKRSEDLRARLAVLSERSEAFEAGLARWTAALAPPPTISARELSVRGADAGRRLAARPARARRPRAVACRTTS